MKKLFVFFAASVLILIQGLDSCSLASNNTYSIKIAIKKYKTGNYTGCIQDCTSIVRVSPSNAIAYYYMAMAYAQAGNKAEAIKAYSKVLSISKNSTLRTFATTGKRCLETPDKCVPEDTSGPQGAPSEIDKFINSPFTDGLSPSVRKDFEQKRLDSIKNDINNDKEPDYLKLKQLDSGEQKFSSVENKNEKQSKQPTNDEIIAALKVLKDAGLSSYPQIQSLANGTTANPYDQTANYQNPQMAQINMLMNENNSSNDNNGAMLNMLPFMLAQNKDGKSNYSPQLIQAAIMNSMMTNLNFDVNNGDRY